jgi:hypothetical protein
MMIGKFLDGKGRETQAISEPQASFFSHFFVPMQAQDSNQ